MSVLLPAIAIAGLAFGPYLGRLAYSNHRQARLIGTTEATPALDVRPNATVEVAGTVAADAETFPSPVAATPAVACVWRVDAWSERGGTPLWRPLATGVRSVPFEIEDRSGRQAIDVGTHVYDLSSLRELVRAFAGGQDAVRVGLVRDGLTLDMAGWTDRVEVPPDETPPDSIQRFVDETEAVSPASDSITNVVDLGKKHGRRRYREALLVPGDPCYALGTTDDGGTLSIDPGELTLGIGREADVLARKRSRARRGGVASVAILLAGLGAAAMLL